MKTYSDLATQHDVIKSAEGGKVYKATVWTQLNRFLILGSDYNTYYASAQQNLTQNFDTLKKCLETDGKRTVAEIVKVSQSGSSVKNDAAIFALAFAIKRGDLETRRAAEQAVPVVCRTGTHMFQFMQFVKDLGGGFGKITSRAVGSWYNNKSPEKLAYQLVKYRQRDGWTHRDVLRLAHAKPASDKHNDVLHWTTKGWDGVGEEPHPERHLKQIWAYERAKSAGSEAEIIGLIREHRLPHECIPTQFKNKPAVQSVLLENMPVTAMVRNLASYTASGLLTNTSDATKHVVAVLSDKERVQKSRIHPMSIFIASKTYQMGRGRRGKLTWTPCARILEALETAFYHSFKNVEPIGGKVLVAIDTSGSMLSADAAGVEGVSVVEAAAAMATVFAQTEDDVDFVQFDKELKPITITRRQSFQDVAQNIFSRSGGATYCSLPFQYMIEKKLAYDSVVMLTDTQTWGGRGHYGWGRSSSKTDAQWIAEARRKVNPNMRFTPLALQANSLSLTRESDPLTLNLCGLDANVYPLIANFAKGKF